MELPSEIKTSLQRECSLYANAMAYYLNILDDFEVKYRMETKDFLVRFEAGQLGDEADFFEWYAFARLLSQWEKSLLSLRSAIQ